MLTTKVFRNFRERWDGWTTAKVTTMEPLDHPSLKDMDWRELADLPLDRAGFGGNAAKAKACPDAPRQAVS
jgi:hypothetical protein